jgi:hypothetical protein
MRAATDPGPDALWVFENGGISKMVTRGHRTKLIKREDGKGTYFIYVIHRV